MEDAMCNVLAVVHKLIQSAFENRGPLGPIMDVQCAV